MQKVVGSPSKSKRQPYAQSPSPPEFFHLSLVGCVEANGEKMVPHLIISDTKSRNKSEERTAAELAMLLPTHMERAGWKLHHTKSGYLTEVVMLQWIASFAAFAEELGRKRGTDRIILLTDNWKSHATRAVREAFAAANIDLFLLPPNCTFRFQPCDDQVFLIFKNHYRKCERDYLRSFKTYALPRGPEQAIRWAEESWNMVTRRAIVYSFRGISRPNLALLKQRALPDRDEMEGVSPKNYAIAKHAVELLNPSRPKEVQIGVQVSAPSVDVAPSRVLFALATKKHAKRRAREQEEEDSDSDEDFQPQQKRRHARREKK